MPYKGLGFLKGRITEPCVREWADELRPGAKTTLYAVLKFLEWIQANGYFPSAKAMLDDQKKCRKSDDEDEEYKHLKMVKKYLASKKYLTGPHKGEQVGTADRQATYSAIRNFYNHFHRDLPQLRPGEFDTLFAATDLDGRRAGELTPLKAEDVRRFALALPQPWRAVIVVLFQGALGVAEFEQFNRSLWSNIVKDLNKPGPVKVTGLIRQKTAARQAARKPKVPVYYTFLGKDAKEQIREWLKIRPKVTLPHLFVVRQMDAEKRAKQGEWTAVSANTIQKDTTTWAKRSGLVQESDLERYRIHAHELRDLFASICSTNGVSKVATEFFLGHDIDRFHYDKSPDIFPDHYRNEYKKVEPQLNIISMPIGGEEEAKRAAREEFIRMRLQWEHVPEGEYANRDLASMTVDEVNELVRTKGSASTATNGGQPVPNGRTQKVVPMSAVEEWVERGWEFVTRLPTGNAVIRRL